MRHLIASTLELLERAGIPYCVLHGSEEMGNELAGDVDVAIRPQDFGLVEKLLYSQQEPFCVQLLQHTSTGFYFVLAAPDTQTIRFLRLDLATDYRRNGRLFMKSTELLADRQLKDGIWISSPAAEFRYLLVKKVLKGAIPSSQQQRLRILAQQLGPEAETLTARFFGNGRAEAILSWLGRGDWITLEGNLPSLRRTLRQATFRQDPLVFFRYWLPDLRRIWRRWRLPTGLFIAVLGPDGSGKSALIDRLPAILKNAFRRSDAFHLRPRLMPAAGSRGPVSEPHAKQPRGRLLSILKLIYLTLDYSFGYLLRVRPLLVRSSLVLFDRYFHDFLVDPIRYRFGGPSWVLRLAGRFVAKPDLFLILDVPEQELLARKQEVPLAEAKRQRAAYRNLAAELPNAVLLPGQSTKKEVEGEAAEAILSFLRWRYRCRRHNWLHPAPSEALNWLSPVLCVDLHHTEGQSAIPRRSGAAYWPLALRDGRGYLFPLSPPRPAVAALRLYNAQNLKARAAKVCLTAGFAAGLIQPLLPRLERKLSGDQPSAFLLDRLREILGRRELYFAISLGTPGSHRKPVIQVLEATGRTLAYAKIGWNEATCELVGYEAEVLRSLEQNPFAHLLLPRLLYLGRWHERLLCLQSSPPLEAMPASRDLTPYYLEALLELAALEPRRLQLGESPFWEDLNRWASMMKRSSYGIVLSKTLGRIQDRLGALKLPFRFCHGDFVPWNALALGERLFLFDWEYARRQWLPGFDLFHFLIQTRLLLGKASPARIFREVVAIVSRMEAVRIYWERLQIEERNVCILMLLYLLERVVYHGYVNPGHYPVLQQTLALADLCLAEAGLLP
jgi:thymidylate kinase